MAGVAGRRALLVHDIDIEIDRVIFEFGHGRNAHAHRAIGDMLVGRENFLVAGRCLAGDGGDRQHHAYVRIGIALGERIAGDGDLIARRDLRYDLDIGIGGKRRTRRRGHSDSCLTLRHGTGAICKCRTSDRERGQTA